MDADSIVRYLKCLKAQHVQVTGKWVRCSCPLAPWLHDSGKDTSPSFAIRVEPNQKSYFNCFACKSGKLGDLVAELHHLKGQNLGMDLAGAYALVEIEDQQKLNLQVKDWGATTPVEPELVIPEWWLETFPPAWPVPYAREYLESRRVTEAIAQELDIRWDRSWRVVCFPVRNAEGELVSMRGRYIQPEPGKASYHVYPFMKQTNGQAWLREHRVEYTRPVLIPESVFDLTSCFRVYDNVISPMSVGINAARIKRIAKGVEYVTLFDAGKGGDKARALMQKYLGSALLIQLRPPAPYKDAGEMPVEALRALLGPYLKLTLS